MFTWNVCVLLTSVSLKSSFRSPAEKKQQNKQEWKHSSGAPNDGFLLNALKTLSGYPEYFQLFRKILSILSGAIKFVSVRSS